MEKWNPEQLRKSSERIKSDSELLEGANRGRLIQESDFETKEPLAPRLEISEQTLAKKKAFNELLGGLFDETTLDAYLQSAYKDVTFEFGKDTHYTAKLSTGRELTVDRWTVDKRLSLNVDFDELKSYVKDYIKKHFMEEIENFKKRTLH